MKIKTMKYIDFNLWMTLLAMTKGQFEKPVTRQLITVKENNVLPEYPRDLTKFEKPTIIVMRVGDNITRMNFLGQAYDAEQNLLYDVEGKHHEVECQIDIFADTNTQMLLLTSVLTDDLLGSTTFDIRDFTDKSLPVIGVARVMPEMDTVVLGSNRNNDYRMAVRFTVSIIQTIVPEQEIVDLGKWLKVTQHVRIS